MLKKQYFKSAIAFLIMIFIFPVIFFFTDKKDFSETENRPLEKRPEISVTWFRPDDRKDGGAYLTWSGSLKKMDMYERKLVFTDGRSIPIDSIRSVECGLDEKNIPGDG